MATRKVVKKVSPAVKKSITIALNDNARNAELSLADIVAWVEAVREAAAEAAGGALTDEAIYINSYHVSLEWTSTDGEDDEEY